MNSYTRTAIALAAGPELPRLLNRFLGVHDEHRHGGSVRWPQ